MTKVRGPLFSIKAAGTLGKSITYKKGVFGNVVRNYRRPKIKKTAGQQTVRWWFQRGVWTWQGKSGEHGYYFSRGCYGLEEPARAAWRLFRTVRSLYGYYAFMKRWMEKSLIGKPQYQVPPYFGFCVANEWFSNFLYADGRFHDWTSPLPPIIKEEVDQYVEGLVALWHCNEDLWDGTPNEVVDSSGQENHGVRGGSATTKAGHFGNGGTFIKATNDCVDLGTSSSLTPVNLTIIMWIKRTESWNGTGSTAFIWAKTGGWSSTGYWLGAEGTDPVYEGIRLITDGTRIAFVNITPNDFFPLDEYIQIAVVFDTTANTTTFYKNGVKQVTSYRSGLPTTSITPHSSPKYIGRLGIYNQYTTMDVDEVAIANRVISEEEILSIYEKNLPLRATP